MGLRVFRAGHPDFARAVLSTAAAVLSTAAAVLIAFPVYSVDAVAQTTPAPAPPSAPTPPEAVVGGYGSDGLAIVRWGDPAKPGDPPVARLLASLHSPTFVARDPGRRVLYVTSELSPDKGNLFAITFDGKIMSRVGSGGGAPVRTAVSGDRLAVANYDGSVALFGRSAKGAIGPMLARATTTGSGPNIERQSSSHPHSVTFTPDGSGLWVADLGADVVVRYELGAKRASLRDVERVTMGAESGPRQVTLGANGLLYVASELDGHIGILRSVTQPIAPNAASTIAASTIAASTIAASTAATSTTAASAASTADTAKVVPKSVTQLVRRVAVRPQARLGEVTLSPDGRWLVALSRGTSECVVYAVQGDNLLEHSHIGCGDGPRHAVFSMSGAARGASWFFVAAQRSNEVRVYRFDDRAGTLSLLKSLPFSKPAVVIPLAK